MSDSAVNYKISIITPSFNQGNFIEETILSVMNQDYENYEHIIIDGGSSDNTIDILTKYKHLIWISEKDDGQSDAFNKGLKLASGDIIGWINSDDYYKENIFRNVSAHFSDESVGWIVGNTVNYYEAIDYLEHEKTIEVTYNKLINDPGMTRQPGAFYRKSILEIVGGLNKDNHLSMDYELWLNLTKISSPKMVDEFYSYFRIHSMQKTSGKTLVHSIKEIERVLRNENLSSFRIKYIMRKRYKSLLKYYIKMLLIKTKILDRDNEYLSYKLRKIVAKIK